MLKLHDIFLRKFLLLFTGIFLVIAVLSYFWIKNIFIEQTKINLLNNIDLFSLQIKSLENIDQKVKDVKDTIGLRVTLIDEKGSVIGESDKNKNTMDNHLNRTEILQSKYQNYGSIVRYSDTFKKDFVYVSKMYTVNNVKYFIRMAHDVERIDEEYFSLTLKVAILFIVSIVVFFVVALKLSKQVEHETNSVLDFLNRLIKQNKSLQIESDYSIEFQKITKLLTKVSESLSKKDKQKSKYTAKLKLSNRQKDDIISAISHEFKNPIAVISGYSQTLLDDKDLNTKIRDKFLNKIVLNSLKLTDMIDRLRLSIKLEEGKQPYSFTKINLKTITQHIVEDLKVTYPSREISITSEDIFKEVDETIISIAITNLVENALKYSQDDIEINITNKCLSVSDTGIGIKNKDISKLTEKFYRVSNNGWNNSMGVGLSLVSNILQIHKFSLDIKSVENEGSTFSIVF